MARRPTTILALVAATALVAGCGADTERATDEQQVRAVVERFAVASRAKDYQTICDRLLARSLVDRVEQIGLPCEVALQRGLSAVQNPQLTVRQVSVGPGRALVSVHSTATGQPASDDAIQLTLEDGEWRIASLATPEAQSSSTPAPASSAVPSTTPTTSTTRTTSTTKAKR